MAYVPRSQAGTGASLAEHGDHTSLWLTGLAKVIPQMVCAQPIHITATHTQGSEEQSTVTRVAEPKRHHQPCCAPVHHTELAGTTVRL